MNTKNAIRDERKGLLYRYTQSLANFDYYENMENEKKDRKDSMKGYFTSDKSSIQYELANHRKALLLIRFAFELFLRWNKDDIKHYTDKKLLEKMKLYDIYTKYIIFPMELDKNEDYFFLWYLLYDEGLKEYDEKKYVIRYYHKILNGTVYKSKKGFFSTTPDGKRRACICFWEMVRMYESFSSVREMYEYFASPNGKNDLNNYGFRNAWQSIFGSPVAFLHAALPEGQRDDFLFHYYNFQYYYNLEAKK